MPDLSLCSAAVASLLTQREHKENAEVERKEKAEAEKQKAEAERKEKVAHAFSWHKRYVEHTSAYERAPRTGTDTDKGQRPRLEIIEREQSEIIYCVRVHAHIRLCVLRVQAAKEAEARAKAQV